MAEHPVVHFEIMGRDASLLRDFYAGLFGWEVAEVHPGAGYHVVDDGGVGGGIGGFEGVDPYVTVYVQADDLPGTLARAEALGATTVMAPREASPGLTVALLRDPEGHLVGLMDRADRADPA
ncbi:VOC family protein [Conexibacter woesei]|uniref:Glyoxalase/bleomycin resistance protein/dioxygenase n=1 Tax=Conexibacter woesei (strain DSM 14684 / CCUG 47730 / CIP 108061 / JCM 11494 / NBRC 100937 / ID131577) TaxID=469383 RepID=D3F9R2_CONWI|nr:VOC family protein [Conexibacter woesei]ADB51124.1 Glyoxalase/bleomycin resistance protein/dioxygenase [Conexibacter woesei DSM 14684]